MIGFKIGESLHRFFDYFVYGSNNYIRMRMGLHDGGIPVQAIPLFIWNVE